MRRQSSGHPHVLVVADEDAALHPRLLRARSLFNCKNERSSLLLSWKAKKKKELFRVSIFFFDFFFVLCFLLLFGRTKQRVCTTLKEINANTHHLWNDDDDENDEYFTPFETKKTKRDYYSYCDYFDDDEQ